MTAPRWSPKEALEWLREWGSMAAGRMTQREYVRRWPSIPVEEAIAALETLLSEHEAVKAKLAAYERDHLMRPDNRNDPTALSGVETHYGKPAAAVPNASEGVESLQRWFNTFRIVDASGNARFLECIVAVDGALTKAVAAVPSDDEIRKQLQWARDGERVSAVCTLVEMVCQRIGVKL